MGKWKSTVFQKAETALDKNFLPHLGRSDKNRKDKAIFLGEMAYRIIQLKLGRRQPDDKDHFKNKRSKTCGPLLADPIPCFLQKLNQGHKVPT